MLEEVGRYCCCGCTNPIRNYLPPFVVVVIEKGGLLEREEVMILHFASIQTLRFQKLLVDCSVAHPPPKKVN